MKEEINTNDENTEERKHEIICDFRVSKFSCFLGLIPAFHKPNHLKA